MRFAIVGILAASLLTPIEQEQKQTEFQNGVSSRGKYVTLMAYVPKAPPAWGQRTSLLLQVTPGPNMHLYAPGQKGYTAVTLSLEPTQALRALRVTFPKSTVFEYVPLNEKVQVYSAPFTIRQDVILSTAGRLGVNASSGGRLDVSGTFSYQACDDQVCYRPETLKVEWFVTVKPLP